MTTSALFPPNRRAFLGAFGAALFTTPGLFAEQLLSTPRLTEGPFYPDRMPLDKDNDLIILGDKLTPAVGEITHLTGKVLDASGSPVKNAVVEIWQCDANAVYLHTADSGSRQAQQDQNFQGFGRCETGSQGVSRSARPAHSCQSQTGRSRVADDSVAGARSSGQRARQHLPRNSRRDRPRTDPGRFQANERIEDRRVVRQLPDRARPHAGRIRPRITPADATLMPIP
ncbi:MAG: protocatechuate 3 4-dioxygenase beta subunit [Planctomycetota bacterium]|nr:MAG: protocatechuate 3 4-dioxygenase beta subunit [Planctomycetota bacterium]